MQKLLAIAEEIQVQLVAYNTLNLVSGVAVLRIENSQSASYLKLKMLSALPCSQTLVVMVPGQGWKTLH